MSTSVKLFFHQQGEGIPLVLLHGFPFDHSIWGAVLPEMQTKVKIILPDLRGLGRSPSSGPVSTMENMAEDIVRLLDGMHIERTIMAGHSMGGYVSMAFAREYPDRLLGLGLVATHAAPDTENIAENRRKQADEVQKDGPGMLAESMPERLLFHTEKADEIRSLIRGMNAEGVSAAMRGMASRSASYDVLSAIDLPVAVVAGREDKIVALQTASDLAGMVKNARLFDIPESGHMPMIEAPRLVAEALDWLVKQTG